MKKGILYVFCAVLSAVSAGAGTLNVTFTSIASGSVVNLTQQGALDWVHWGLFTETSVDRKGGVQALISDFTPVDQPEGFVYIYQYGDNANGYSWGDGTPHMAVTNTTTGVWAYGTPTPAGSGFTFHVPAGTNLQTLKVYVGAFRAQGRFVATLSDGSAPEYVNPANQTVSNSANGPSAVYSINFAANSSDQTLTITYTVQQSFRPDGNVTLQAAAVSAPGANNLPFVSLTAPAEGSTYAAPSDILLSAIASDADGSISRVEFYADDTKLGETTTAPYQLTWSGAAPGNYVLTARTVDDAGGASVSAPVHVFVAGSGGTLTGSRTTPPLTLDLTAEGTSDWAHWGLVDAADFNHKSAGASQIGDITRIGAHPTERYEDNHTAFSWSDGMPVAAANNTNVGVFVTGLTNGFEITAPADTNTRTLRVYCGLYGAQGNFQAWLSDFSARAFTDTSVSNTFANSYSAYTLTYSAPAANQRLHIRYTVQNLFDFAFGNVTLQAATLQGALVQQTNPPPAVTITTPAVQAGAILFEFPTEFGHTYAVQRIDAIPSTAWQTFTNVNGNGSAAQISDAVTSATQRFYRVVAQ